MAVGRARCLRPGRRGRRGHGRSRHGGSCRGDGASGVTVGGRPQATVAGPDGDARAVRGDWSYSDGRVCCGLCPSTRRSPWKPSNRHTEPVSCS
ncbi:hypothetical protein [Ornithinimicrobium kibberense]|uniref:hypothetical protein n=1 Tax=Ornithinimicrobium kibberense TaxID=282060 RepID=UPI00361FB8E2